MFNDSRHDAGGSIQPTVQGGVYKGKRLQGGAFTAGGVYRGEIHSRLIPRDCGLAPREEGSKHGTKIDISHLQASPYILNTS